MLKKVLSMLTRRSKETPVYRIGDPGMATHSIIRIDGDGHRHEHRVGLTGYGSGYEPAGGHKPDTVIVTDDQKRLS